MTMTDKTFTRPSSLADLVRARNAVRDHDSSSGLRFTFDGNLMGDLGEAIAAELFGLRLEKVGGTDIDGTAPDGRTANA